MNSEFYRQLYQSICNESNESEDKQYCLITKVEIEKQNCITLHCGHTFDYYALLKEVYNRKYKIKNDVKITKSKIQCPYCRKIQSGILPYRENESKYLYVNFPVEYAMKTNHCNRKLVNNDKICGKLCVHEYCSRCQKIIDKPSCEYILTRGKNKGNTCGKICKANTTKCSLHTKA